MSGTRAYIAPQTGLSGTCWPEVTNPRGDDATWELSCYDVVDSYPTLVEGLTAAQRQGSMTNACIVRAGTLMQHVKKADGSYYDQWEDVPMNAVDYQWLNVVFQALKNRSPLPQECTPVPGTRGMQGYSPSMQQQPSDFSVPWGWIIAGTVFLGGMAVWFFFIRPRRRKR